MYRFTTTGDQALTFEIFKYGRPDPDMERPWDISARVEMTSVRYLHTMRFLKEMLAFCSHFPQLIDAFQRMKAMAQGNLVSSIIDFLVLVRFSTTAHLYGSVMYERFLCTVQIREKRSVV